MDHWKAELNSSVFRRVLNDLSESASRVLELETVPNGWRAKTETASGCCRPPKRYPKKMLFSCKTN